MPIRRTRKNGEKNGNGKNGINGDPLTDGANSKNLIINKALQELLSKVNDIQKTLSDLQEEVGLQSKSKKVAEEMKGLPSAPVKDGYVLPASTQPVTALAKIDPNVMIVKLEEEMGPGAAAAFKKAVKKAETEDVEKWLWSLSVIKKIVTEDISAPLDEYDIGGLAMVMEAPGDWEKMRKFLESLYDLGHVDMAGTTKEVLNRIADLNDATLAAIKECSDVQIEMDPNTRISFDHYAVAATEVIAKILLEKDPAVSIDYYLRIDRENLRAAVESIKDLCGEPEKITGEGEPEKIIDVPVESAGGSGGEAVSPPEKQYEEEGPAYEYKPKRKVGKWIGAVLGGLAVAGLCIYGGMKLNQYTAEKKEKGAQLKENDTSYEEQLEEVKKGMRVEHEWKGLEALGAKTIKSSKYEVYTVESEEEKTEIAKLMLEHKNKIKDKYGERGEQIYELMDGTRTVEHVGILTNTNKEEMKKIIIYMQDKDMAGGVSGISSDKIILWEKPGAADYAKEFGIKKPKPYAAGYWAFEQPRKKFETFDYASSSKDSAEKLLLDYKSASEAKLQKSGLLSLSEERLEEHRKVMKMKYGEKGLKVYDSINSLETIEDLRLRADLSKEKMLDIIRFMRRNYFVFLKPRELDTENRDYNECCVTDKGIIYEVAKSDAIDVYYLFSKSTPNGLTKETIEKAITDTYGEKGLRVYNLIDGKKDCEEIRKETGLTRDEMYDLMRFLGQTALVDRKKLSFEQFYDMPKKK